MVADAVVQYLSKALCSSLILSRFNFGISNCYNYLDVWSKPANLASATNNLAPKVQKLACTCITRDMRICPTAAIDVVLDLAHFQIVPHLE